jgi:hypothetical protein
MNEFLVFLELGFDHICDFGGFDHMLFLLTLLALYKYEQWKKVLVLVTAFTLGHSITLALSALSLIEPNERVIEFLIPVTIILTAIYNLKKGGVTKSDGKVLFNYLLAFGFGLIHGMGFSYYFGALMMGSESIVLPLFSFNLGIELGQLVIVAVIWPGQFLFFKFVNASHLKWNIALSSFGGLLALGLTIKQFI